MHTGRGATIESAREMRKTVSRLMGYVKPYTLSVTGIMVLVVLSTGLGVAGPMLIGIAVDRFIQVGDVAGLVSLSILMLIIFIALWATTTAQTYWMVVVGQKVEKEIRADIFDRIEEMSLGFFDRHDAGDVMSRMTNDVHTIRHLLSGSAIQLVSSALLLLGIMIAMLSLNWMLAIGTLAVLVPMVLVTGAVTRRSRQAFRRTQAALGAINAFMEENIVGVRVVKAFARERETIGEFQVANVETRDAGIEAEVISAILMPALNVMSYLSIAIVVGWGGWLTLQGAITVGIIITFIAYSRQFFQPLRQLAGLYNQLQSALAGAERIFEVLDEKPDIVDLPDAQPLPQIQGKVEFDGVGFAYVPGVPVLEDINLTAEPGQIIALVGLTGAGKTTIINLLTRFYDVAEGAIRIDGHDIRAVQQDSLRRQLGVVLQDTFLFSGTVMENIRYGNLEASDEAVVDAAKMANADQFISRLPQGYYTEVTERGSNFSQGQRQLIAIARAVLADPRILILDEATSSVDTRTEAQIQSALLRLMRGRTSFVIAHRLSTIRNADLVLVVGDRRVVERGTHEELLSQGGVYHSLYMSQFRRAELAEELAAESAASSSG
jgi:ATP-binding cassette subfamily B protein